MNRPAIKNITSIRHARTNPLVALFSALALSLLGAVAWAQAPVAADFQRTTVASGIDLPQEFEISKDGRVFVVSKCGKFYGWKLNGGTATQTSTVPNVRCEFEDGLLSLALDPNFVTNSYLYVQYTSPGSKTRVSRFTVNADNSLDTASEKIVLEWLTGREAAGHMGGSLKFDRDGNLLITTGDCNAATGYFSSGAQETSGNTFDLRGKVLRITPTAAGAYTIPAGNLFPADATHRGEIYGMGFRNPYRLSVDPSTNYYYLGDIGPDAGADSAEGPGGMDELNELKEPGNYGWPYIIGYNQPYAGFNPTTITNNFAQNTGSKTLPPAKPALWTIPHRATMAGPVYRFNDAIKNDFKLPQYYNGRLIYWDFSSSKFFTINLADKASPPVPEDFPLNTGGFQGAIDAELDPTTHQLYVLQWGSGCCDKTPYNNGALYRFDYIGDRDDGVNLALGASVVSVTSSAGGNTADKMFDGIDGTVTTKTRWESAQSDPQGFVIDLRTDSQIASFVIKWEAAYSSKYTIEGSLSATGPWTMLVDESNGAGNTELKLVNAAQAANKYRYVRFTGLARASNYGHSIYEFEVHAGKATTETPLTEFAYLNMPKTLDASFTGVPKLLSQTGAFSNTATLTPIANMIPFAPNSPLWSDRAEKSRWLSLPKSTKINWSAKDNWTYPQGTVAVKEFDLPVDARNATITKRLETRLIVTKADGSVYGVTYKWRADNSDADLLTTSATQNFTITNADSTTSQQTWTYPSPQDCLSCHNSSSSQILGLSTRQLNGNYAYPGGASENQLVHWNNLGVFTPALNNAQVGGYDKLAALSDTSASLEKRVKSYLDANCAHCHGTGNGGSQWDARYNTPIAQMKILNALTTGIREYDKDYGINAAKVIAAGNPMQSILYIRDKSVNPNDRMPPLGRSLEHKEYIDLLNQWIISLNAVTKIPSAPAKLTPALATASTANGGNTAAAATDGNYTTTRWESAQKVDPSWISLDMGKSMYFSKVVLTWEPAYATAYTIDVSETGNANDWQTVYSTTTGRGGVETIILDGAKGRYIRMNGTVRKTDFGYSLYEFEAFGLAADTNPTLINFVTPVADAVIDQNTSVTLKVAISDANWLPNNGYNYYLDNNAAVRATAEEIDLGLLPTGQHSLRVSLADGAGLDVGVPRVEKFRVSCGTTCPKVLIFSKTSGFRHDSIPAGIAMVQKIAADNGYSVTASEDSSLFTTANLANYSTIVFMNTTGDIFDANQEAAFKAYIEGGGGFVGTHSAADTEHGWAWYTGTLLGGGEFDHHGDGIPKAKVVIEKPTNTLVNHIGTEWTLSDEWYFWKKDPRAFSSVEVLGTLDRSSYTSNYPVADHPVIYTNLIGKGRIFYTAVGHVDGNFADPNMVEMIRKAIEWTSGQTPPSASSSSRSSSSSKASSVSSLSSSSKASSSAINVASSAASSSQNSLASSVASSSKTSVSSTKSSSSSSVSSSSANAGVSSSKISSAPSSAVSSASSAFSSAKSSTSSTTVVVNASSSVASSTNSAASSAVRSSSPSSSAAASSTAPSPSEPPKKEGGGGAIDWRMLLLLSLISAGIFMRRSKHITE
jgi:uncharacterized repeat protein (TIGR03806 family)